MINTSLSANVVPRPCAISKTFSPPSSAARRLNSKLRRRLVATFLISNEHFAQFKLDHTKLVQANQPPQGAAGSQRLFKIVFPLRTFASCGGLGFQSLLVLFCQNSLFFPICFCRFSFANCLQLRRNRTPLATKHFQPNNPPNSP